MEDKELKAAVGGGANTYAITTLWATLMLVPMGDAEKRRFVAEHPRDPFEIERLCNSTRTLIKIRDNPHLYRINYRQLGQEKPAIGIGLCCTTSHQILGCHSDGDSGNRKTTLVDGDTFYSA